MFLRYFSFLWLFLYAPLVFAAPFQVHTYFSPNGGAQEAILRNISNANRSIDIAMYNFSSDKILKALESVKRNNKKLKIRMIFDDAASTEVDSPGSSSKADMSASLEKIGIDVRYVSKIMHHKFVIIDGFPDGLEGNENFSDTVLLNGSGNFSNRADTSYDENLVEIKNASPLLRFAISRGGKLLFGNKELFNRFKILAWRQYLDTARLREVRKKILKKWVEAI